MTYQVIALGYQPNWYQILNSPFMHNALIGGTIVALASGLIGLFVVVRGHAFAAHALAHIGFPGATGAALLGFPVTYGLSAFCIGGALVIGVLGKRVIDRDVATGTVLALAMGLGLFLNSLSTTRSVMTNVLFGNLLAISQQQLMMFAGLLALIALSVGIAYRPLLYSSVNPQVAEARGVPVRMLAIFFMVLLGLAVTMAVQVVGTLLLFALVVTPAAAAIIITPRPGRAILISTLISLSAVWVGLVLSAMFDVPPSFVIVTFAGGAWLLVWTIATIARPKPNVRPSGHASRAGRHPSGAADAG